MVSESWFRSLWRSPKKHNENVEIGVLAFELASLMSKLINLWDSLGDKQVAKLREEIMNAVGIKKLVSEDEDHIVKLMSVELMENLSHVARTVARVSKKCNDPVLKNFEEAFNDICRNGVDSYGWLLTMKKMEKNMEKMERLVLYTADLYHEIEALKGLEQMLWRIKCSDDVDSVGLVEYEKKIAWKQQEIKHLKQISIWNRTYDYVVLLFASSLFTVFCKTGHVFGIDCRVDDSAVLESNNRGRLAAFTQSSVHPSGGANAISGPIVGRRNKKNIHYSAPLESSLAGSSSMSVKHDIVNFYSGPLVKSVTKSGMLAKPSKSGFRLWRFPNRWSFSQVKIPFSRHTKKVKTSGQFSMIMDLNNGSSHGDVVKRVRGHRTIFSSRNRLLNAPADTLGGAALALHYANIIIVIEKLVASPHLISEDARDDLYTMLPASIRVALTAKLKPYAKILTCSVYDKVLAAEWNESISGILEWLAPLAHNMIRWQSERSFEHHQTSVSRTNVLLVQTLYFANKEKTEATVTELLLGLNYISRYSKELHAAALLECDSGITIDDYLEN